MIKEIPDSQIETARMVLEDHIVEPITREGALESLFFCIASQAAPWERASQFVYSLRELSHGNKGQYASWRDLTDDGKVKLAAKSSRFRFEYADRFGAAMDYFRSKEGEWWGEIIVADGETRERYCDEIKWVGRKTFSFWNLCLGGNQLAVLDVHVMRGLNELGVEMNPYFFESLKRRNGTKQNVRKTPGKRDYLRIEAEARQIFSRDDRFLLPNGEVDMALVDSVLWWRGANRNGATQMNLFGNVSASYNLPYSSEVVLSKN